MLNLKVGLSTSCLLLTIKLVICGYVLHRKNQVYEKFREWKAAVEKSTGRKVKAIRTDTGREFTSREFESYLTTEGVCHDLTIPNIPEQNGVEERMNRTLVEMARSMLVNSKLPCSFWAEVLSTVTYLHNRSPSKAVAGILTKPGLGESLKWTE